MRYIVEETLIPWVPSGASTTSFIAEDFSQMRTMVHKLLEEAKRLYEFTSDDLEDVEMWEDECEEGYLECYLNDDKPYSSWSVVWKPESNFNL